MPRRIVLELAYDGAPYSGFVRQTNGNTVAAELERALTAIDPNASPVTAASRTDAGVHARGQIASFTTEKEISSRGWVLALAHHLPPTVVAVRAGRAPLDFDPRIDPTEKTYRYRVLRSSTMDPFLQNRVFRVHHSLDVERMRRAARDLEGEHDFAAFRSAADVRTNTVRCIERVTIENAPEDSRILDIQVVGHRFMHNMVRIIAGTLVDVGRGRIGEGSVRAALESKERTALGMTAPAAGLYLERIVLATALTDEWPQRSGH